MTPRHYVECISDGACTFIRTGSFAAGARLVAAISELTRMQDHRPDGDLRHAGVAVRPITITEDSFGLREHDLELARQISAIGRASKVSPPTRPPSRASKSRSTRSSFPR